MAPFAPRGLAASSLLRNHPTSLPTSCRCRCLHSALPCRQGSAEISWGKAMNFRVILSSIRVGLLGIRGIVFSGTLAHPTCLTRLHFRSGLRFVIRLPPHTASRLMQLPSTRGCLPKAPQGSFTLQLITMPNAPGSLRSPPLRRPRKGAGRSEAEQFTEGILHPLGLRLRLAGDRHL